MTVRTDHPYPEVLDPTGRADTNQDTSLAPRGTAIRGATLGLLDNGKVNGGVLLEELGRQLEVSAAVGSVRLFTKPYAGQPLEPSQLEEISKECDFVVTAIGDCGSCSAATLADGILLERSGVPAVSICTEPFGVSAAAMAQTYGFPGYQFALTPHPVASLSREEIRARVADLVPRVLSILGAA